MRGVENGYIGLGHFLWNLIKKRIDREASSTLPLSYSRPLSWIFFPFCSFRVSDCLFYRDRFMRFESDQIPLAIMSASGSQQPSSSRFMDKVPKQKMPNMFFRVMRKAYRPLGFQKGYNFTLCRNFPIHISSLDLTPPSFHLWRRYAWLLPSSILIP